MARPKFVTPRGRAYGFVAINSPAENSDKYELRVAVSKDQAEDLKETISEAADEGLSAAKKKKAHLPYFENDEGEIVFKMKTGKEYPPILRNRKGEELNYRPKVGPGSLVRAAGTIGCSSPQKDKHYVTLYMNEVKIAKLVEFSGSAFGNDEDDDLEDEDDLPTTGGKDQSETSSMASEEEPEGEEDDDGNF
jgi:hypothetical protein